MRIDLPAGTYVVAVSGGVDSVALLHLLVGQSLELRVQKLENSGNTNSVDDSYEASEMKMDSRLEGNDENRVRLIVAHMDHGIREDSAADRRLVQELAKHYGLPFVYHEAKLGPDTSEADARQARYSFLRETRRVSRAQSIITAHHQDDVLETIILNLLRGTNRKGLHALKTTTELYRPLVHVPKSALVDYARLHELEWREDATNANEAYLRNYVRLRLLPRFRPADRQRLLGLSEQTALLDQVISEQLGNYLHMQPSTERLDRALFVQLPHIVAREVMAEWLRLRCQAELSNQLLERLVVAAKTGQAGSKYDVDKTGWLQVEADVLALTMRER